ncbi:hypothetical protein ALC56_00166, partial [Trachymyrmex septentrionalis]
LSSRYNLNDRSTLAVDVPGTWGKKKKMHRPATRRCTFAYREVFRSAIVAPCRRCCMSLVCRRRE